MKTNNLYFSRLTQAPLAALLALLVQAALGDEVAPRSAVVERGERMPPYSTLFVASDAADAEQEFMNLRRYFALSIPESLQSSSDPNGNWGAAVRGTQISVRLRQEVFLTNSSVVALVIYRNTGNQTRHYLHEGMVGTGYEFTLACGTNVQVWTTPEPERTNLRAGGTWPFTMDLPPKSQLAFAMRLDSIFDLSQACDYELKVLRHEAAPGETNSATISAAGAKFKVVSKMTSEQLDASTSFGRQLRQLRQQFHQHVQQGQAAQQFDIPTNPPNQYR